MIDFTKVNDILKGTASVAQAQQKANAAQAAPPQSAAGPATASQDAANELFAQLGALITNAANQPAQASADPDLAELQREAAMINAKATALIAKADELEGELNLSPTPETKNVDELLGQIKEVLQELDQEIAALQKKIDERKKANEMQLKQKPTAMKVGEHVGDDSEHGDDCNNNPFNTTLSVV